MKQKQITQMTLRDWIDSFENKEMEQGIKKVINKEGVFIIEWK